MWNPIWKLGRINLKEFIGGNPDIGRRKKIKLTK
jgi:hypothetical protein